MSVQMEALLSRPLYLNSDHNHDNFTYPNTKNSGLKRKASHPQHAMSCEMANVDQP